MALVALVGPVQARAQSAQPVELVWNAPAGCASAQDVLDRIRKLAGSAKSSGTPLRAEATITRRDKGGLHLKLVVHAGNLVGERNIDGTSCDDLVGATAVNLALLLNSAEPLSERDLSGHGQPSAGDHEQAGIGTSSDASSASGSRSGDQGDQSDRAPKPPEPTQASRGERQPAPAAAQAPADEASSSRSWHGLLQVPLVSLGIGPLPRPSPGVGLAAGVLVEPWSFLAGGSAWLRQELKATDHPGLGASVDRVDASLRMCRTILFGRFQAAPCLSVSLNHIWSRGMGSHVAPRTDEATWVGAGVGAQVRLHLATWFGLIGAVDGQIEAARPRISIDGVGRIGQLWPAAVTMTLGSEWIL